MEELTPLMKQYSEIKKDYPDCILLFRLGDFYEMFGEDAIKGSKILNIALTTRDRGKENPIPMCGVPYHSVNTYISKLLKEGLKVAICEQMEEPGLSKGPVKREVIKILTPGTAVEIEDVPSEFLRIASLYKEKERISISFVDLGSWEAKCIEIGFESKIKIEDIISRINPREIILPKSQKEEFLKVLNFGNEFSIAELEDSYFDPFKGKIFVQNHLGVSSLEGIGLGDKPLSISTLSALLQYLKGLRKDELRFLKRVSVQKYYDYMILDSVCIRNLELLKNIRDGVKEGSLYGILDITKTSMGSRLLREWILHPLISKREIENRLEAVEEFFSEPIKRREVRRILDGISDIERLLSKLALNVANPRDLIALKNSIAQLPKLKKTISDFRSELLKEKVSNWDSLEDIYQKIERTIIDDPPSIITEGGIIKDGFHPSIDELKKLSREAKEFIANLERKERERTGINSLKIKFNKVFGYSIEVTKPNLHLVPPDYIRKQTLVNAERFITLELKEWEEKILSAEERVKELEYEAFLIIREEIAKERERIQKMANYIAELDTLSTLAEVAFLRKYTKPVINDGDKIIISEGRHPVIEVLRTEEPFIPNDTLIDRSENQILIITGPNMGGKSTYLRQVALIVILAQMGSFVPAREADIGIVDRIFTRIGATDYLVGGQSTFLVEMYETASILHNATERSLVLLDEIGRGTSTFDGISIAWAVIEFIHERLSCRTLFATHYHELTELTETLKKAKNLHVAVREVKDEVIFLRKIKEGPSDRSFGIQVAKLAGIPREVIMRAKDILIDLERKEMEEMSRRKSTRFRRYFDPNQLPLFPEIIEDERVKKIKERLESIDINSLSPLQALLILNELKEELGKE
ncbi:MAG: DNA mismatch repair protein MutS [Candidatus Aminicenantia bacterium]